MKEFMITGMSCGSCVMHVKQALTHVHGVTSVEVDLKSQRAKVEGEFDTKEAMKAIKGVGYGPVLM